MGHMFARPALSSVLKDSREVRGLFEDYVNKHWIEKRPRFAQEVVVVAAGLTFHDRQTTDQLKPVTKEALRIMWKYQRDDGGWDWQNDGFPPTEYDEHYGVTLAALITGIAPGEYVESEEAQQGLEKVRVFLKNNRPLSLHHRAMIAWTSCYVDGLMDDSGRTKTLQQLRAIQLPNGGWSTPGMLADWKGLKRLDGKPHDTKTADAYGTGFAIVVARALGTPTDDPQLRRGIDWILNNQRVSGKWFSRSTSRDNKHYFTNLGCAFAILALQSCDQLPVWPL